MFILEDNRPRTELGVNYLYNVVKKYIWNMRCKRLDEEEPVTTLSPASFFQALDFRLRINKILPRKLPELVFITSIAARRGIG